MLASSISRKETVQFFLLQLVCSQRHSWAVCWGYELWQALLLWGALGPRKVDAWHLVCVMCLWVLKKFAKVMMRLVCERWPESCVVCGA